MAEGQVRVAVEAAGETRSLAATSNGDWVPLVNPPYKLAEAAAAHAALERREAVGKVVLIP